MHGDLAGGINKNNNVLMDDFQFWTWPEIQDIRPHVFQRLSASEKLFIPN
jgi:hypothetical protein